VIIAFLGVCLGVRRHLDPCEVARCVQMSDDGMSHREIGEIFGVSNSVVSRVVRRFRETGQYTRRHGGGRERATTPVQDRYLRTLVARQRFSNARRLRNEFQNATGVRVSTQTIRNRLHEGGLRARRPAVGPVLTPARRMQRLAFAQDHENWRINQWANVLFTNESRFCQDGNDRRTRVWREQGHRYYDYAVAEHDRWGGPSLMVWGGISIGGRTDLVVLQRVSMNARRYLDMVLRPIVLPYAGAIGENFILMDDNARPHRARLVRDFLDSEGIESMEWPPYSPDLNPIEHVWDHLGRQIREAENPPVTLVDLEQALRAAWTAMTPQFIIRLIRSMRQRCRDVIRVRGGHTQY